MRDDHNQGLFGIGTTHGRLAHAHAAAGTAGIASAVPDVNSQPKHDHDDMDVFGICTTHGASVCLDVASSTGGIASATPDDLFHCEIGTMSSSQLDGIFSDE